MNTLTDNSSEVGLHVFERAGLGKAPFRFIGCYESVFQACPGAPRQPGTSCDYCGTGIMQVFNLRSADGKEFKVGCDCINKSGDAGLIKAYKNAPEVRARARAMRHTREQSVITEFQTRFPDYWSRFADQPHPNAYFASQGKTKADYLLYCWQMNGQTGKAKIARRILKENMSRESCKATAASSILGSSEQTSVERANG